MSRCSSEGRRTGTDENRPEQEAEVNAIQTVRDGEDDFVVEQMLSKAQRLVFEMKEQSGASSSASESLEAGGAGHDSIRGTGSVPATIEMKDCATECSSVGHGILSTDHVVNRGGADVKDDDLTAEKNSVGSGSNATSMRAATDYRDESKACDDSGVASISVSYGFRRNKTSQLSYSTSSSSVSQADIAAAVLAAQEMQKQMEAALKASSHFNVVEPSPEIVGAQSLIEEVQSIPATKCFRKPTNEGKLGRMSEADDSTKHALASKGLSQGEAKEAEKFQGHSSSSSSVSQEDVAAAITAANAMQKQLEEVLRIPFRSEIAEESNQPSVSPIPLQPLDVKVKDVPAVESSSTKLHCTPIANSMAKSDCKGSEYDVTVADYTKPHRLQSSAHRQNDEVTWEKVTSADEGDDDFAPMRDYSKSVHRKMEGIVGPISSRLSYSEHRAAIRSRRRKRRRRMAVILLTAAFAICLVLIRGFAGKEDQHEVVVAPVPLEAPLSSDETPLLIDPLVEDANTDSVLGEFEPKDGLSIEIRTEPTLQIEKQICNFPFASLLSPICRSQHMKRKQPMIKLEAHARAQARREKVEQLIDVMMQ